MQTVVSIPIGAQSCRPVFTRWRIAVAALAVFILFFQLGTRGLNEPDEGRYAEVGREMAASGDWLVPRFNGIEHLSKPPVTYWLIALSIKVFGVNEWAARLPAALGALATALAVALMVTRAGGEEAGLWAAVVLLSCAQFFLVARLITTDMMVTCFAAWSVWALWRWYDSSDRSFGKIMWFYIFLGLGMMTKGPPAVIPPLLAVAGLCWRNRDLKLRQLCWGRGLLIFLAIGLPWYVVLALRQPELWRYFIVREVLERAATGAHGRSKPFWFFIPIMALGFLPWTLAVGRPQCRHREFIRMCATWAGLSFVLFSVVKSKLPTYITPLYAPLSALVALSVARLSVPARRRCGIMAGFFLAFYMVATVLFPKFESKMSHQISARTLAVRIQQEDPTGTAPVVQYQTFMCGLPFYLGHPVAWFHPPRPNEEVDDSVYEFSSAHRGKFILDAEAFQSLLTGTRRAFCIAATRRVKRLENELGISLVTLDRAGDWSLVSNQP